MTDAMRPLRLRTTLRRTVLAVMAGTVLASGAPGWRWRASGTAVAQAAPAALVDLKLYPADARWEEEPPNAFS